MRHLLALALVSVPVAVAAAPCRIEQAQGVFARLGLAKLSASEISYGSGSFERGNGVADVGSDAEARAAAARDCDEGTAWRAKSDPKGHFFCEPARMSAHRQGPLLGFSGDFRTLVSYRAPLKRLADADLAGICGDALRCYDELDASARRHPDYPKLVALVGELRCLSRSAAAR